MHDLFTPRQQPRETRKRFVGKRIALEHVLDTPIEIIDFEIGKSQRTGNELLYLQLKVCNVPRMFWSEGCLLIKTIKAANRANLPFRTKIVRDGKGYLKFAKVS